MTTMMAVSPLHHGLVGVRPFRASDVAQVAALHEAVFPNESGLCSADLEDYLAEIFLGNPWYREALPSLVCEQAGQLVGFAGVLPRDMWVRRRQIRVAVLSQLMVHPDSRSTIAAIALLRSFLSGPQELSFSDGASKIARRLWERVCGVTSLTYSLHWLRVLRPAAFAMNRIFKQPSLAVLARLAYPLVRPVDSLISRLSSNPLAIRHSRADEPLVPDELVGCIRKFSSKCALRPNYSAASMRWLLALAAKKDPPTTLRMRCMRTPDDQIVGWYVYYLTPGGISHVLQLGGGRQHIGSVIDHLLNDAFLHGALALNGRMEPDFADELWARGAVFGLHGAKFLFHSRDPEVLQAISTGDAFLSCLEGEWWMRFHERRA
jgi:hypothetical protein